MSISNIESASIPGPSNSQSCEIEIAEIGAVSVEETKKKDMLALGSTVERAGAQIRIRASGVCKNNYLSFLLRFVMYRFFMSYFCGYLCV